MKIIKPLIFIICSSLLLACAHSTYYAASDSTTVIAEMLDQVNDAIIDAKAATPDAPEVTSVEVDLQLGTSASANANATVPLGGILFPLGQASSNRLHKVSLSFVPKPVVGTQRAVQHNAALTSAIEKIYRSIAQANQHYEFQKGSMQIQCSLDSAVGVSSTAKGGGGSGGGSSRSPQSTSSSSPSSVVLLPLQFDASISNQTVQTITLSFGPRTGPP